MGIITGLNGEGLSAAYRRADAAITTAPFGNIGLPLADLWRMARPHDVARLPVDIASGLFVHLREHRRDAAVEGSADDQPASAPH
ncbi:hypothetical protein GGQ68_002780 [Sagittula marina]|uniref:Uncharacterized protein n=1 Tax=Sagittula marina TaxID=943940 RepID=A0A7W6DRL0_9RHOB|nr:hypothetical protein [Sagittula marina]